jgi:hypothetical protein
MRSTLVAMGGNARGNLQLREQLDIYVTTSAAESILAGTAGAGRLLLASLAKPVFTRS